MVRMLANSAIRSLGLLQRFVLELQVSGSRGFELSAQGSLRSLCLLAHVSRQRFQQTLTIANKQAQIIRQFAPTACFSFSRKRLIIHKFFSISAGTSLRCQLNEPDLQPQ